MALCFWTQQTQSSDTNTSWGSGVGFVMGYVGPHRRFRDPAGSSWCFWGAPRLASGCLFVLPGASGVVFPGVPMCFRQFPGVCSSKPPLQWPLASARPETLAPAPARTICALRTGGAVTGGSWIPFIHLRGHGQARNPSRSPCLHAHMHMARRRG